MILDAPRYNASLISADDVFLQEPVITSADVDKTTTPVTTVVETTSTLHAAEMEPGLNHWPMTRPGRFWPGDPVTRPRHWVYCVLWIDRLLWRRCAIGEYFLPKVSGLCSTHTDHVVKIQNTQNPTDSRMAHSLPKSNNKARAKTTKKLGQTPGLSHWPVTLPDPAKIVTRWAGDPKHEDIDTTPRTFTMRSRVADNYCILVAYFFILWSWDNGAGARGLKGELRIFQDIQRPFLFNTRMRDPETPDELEEQVCRMFYPSVLWHCWSGDRWSIRPVLVCWWWRFEYLCTFIAWTFSMFAFQTQ